MTPEHTPDPEHLSAEPVHDSAVREPMAENGKLPSSAKGPKPVVRRPNRVPIYVAVVAVLALAACGILPRLSQGQRLSADVESVRDQTPIVSTVALARTNGVSSFTLPSNIQAIDQTTIQARTSGYLQQRFVDIGSKVTAGQVLAVVESPEIDQQVSQSEAEVAKSEAGLGQAQADSVRNIASIAEARSDVSKSQAGVMQAEADLSHLKAKEVGAQAAVNVAKANEIRATKRYAGSQAEIKNAQAALDIASKTLNRWRELEKGNAVSGQDVDEKEATFESSKAQLEAANDAANSAEADVQASKESIELASADLNAAKADVQSGVGRVAAARSALGSSRDGVEAAQASYRAGESTVTAAGATIRSNEANVRRVQTMQSFERITAPFSGVVTARNVDVGDLINPTTSASGATDQMNTVTKTGLFGLARTDVLRAQIDVPEDDVALVHDGQEAEISTSEYPGRVFTGKVFNVSGALDATSRTLLVEVRIPNPDGQLKPGMYAQVKFLGASGASSIRIPSNSLLFDAKGTRVAVVSADGTLHYVKVVLGRDFGDQIEVVQGLKGDETLVTNIDDSIPDGAKVKAVSSTSQAD